jgi:hypothetical protein
MADYREMWESLGMDLEKHDLLCEALPEAFGEVYLSQEGRPQGMDFFNFVVAEIHGVRPAELIEHQKNGEKYLEPFACMFPMKLYSRPEALPRACVAVLSSGWLEGKRCCPPIPVP